MASSSSSLPSGLPSDAVAQAHARYADRRPNSAAQAAAAARVLPSGSTRSVLDFAPFPFRVARAYDCWLEDVDGHQYLDLLGDYTAGLLGHNPPAIRAAVESVLERGWSMGAIASDEHRLAELVTERFASMDQVRFTNSGTEANLMAINLARFRTGRNKVMVFDGAYHGGLLYFGATGAGLQAPFDYVRGEYNHLESVERAFARDGADIACVLVEPMMGAGGCIRGTSEFLAGLRELCHQHGVLLIFDEVMTSRMGTGGAQGRLGITPDITTLGKYLGGGMTFGAFGGSQETMSPFAPGGGLTHGGTFNNNAMTMTAGVAALEVMLTPGTLEGLYDRGERLQSQLQDQVAGNGFTVTGWGSIMAIHAVDGPIDAPGDLVDADEVAGELLFHGLLERGFYIARRGFLAVSLAVGDGQLQRFVEALCDVVNIANAHRNSHAR